jgi:hypothetical protein
MEGKQDAMGARLDRLEKIIEDGFAELRKDISDLKSDKSERVGGSKLIQYLLTLATALAAVLGVDWWKGH